MFEDLSIEHLHDSLNRALQLEHELRLCITVEWMLGIPNRGTWEQCDVARTTADQLVTEIARRIAQ